MAAIPRTPGRAMRRLAWAGAVAALAASLPAPAPAAQPGDVVRLGVIITLSGARAANATHMARGYDLAIRKVNEQGGVRVGNRAYRLEAVYRDDESSAPVATRLAREMLAAGGVHFLLGPYGSGPVIAVAEVAEQHRVPMVQSGGASNEIFVANRKYTFGTVTLGDEYLSGAVDLAAETAQRDGRAARDLKVAFVFMEDLFSKDVRLGARERAQDLGMTTVLDVTVPVGLTDLRPVLERVRATAPDLLLMSAQEKGARLLAQQMADLRVDVPMVALTHCDGAQIEDLGPRSDYLLCASQWDAFSRWSGRRFGAAVEFAVEFELVYGYVPPYQAAQGAAAVVVLADAIERAGTLDRKRVRDELARTSLRTFFGPIRFDETGTNIAKPMVLQQIQGGRYNVVWPREAARSPYVLPIPRWDDRDIAPRAEMAPRTATLRR